MRIRRGLAAVGVALGMALTAVPAAAAAPSAPAALSPAVMSAPSASECPYGVRPGPPVDESEQPRPGQAEPPPLPVPNPPVGGAAMGSCGDVSAPGAPAPPSVGSDSYVLADLDTGAVIAARNPHARLRPASLMKTLTGLLVARRLNMNDVLVGTPEDADQEGTRVGMGPGGQYPVRTLLDAMLMASGNDTAHALAVRLTGSVGGTVDLMNRTAQQLGALDTRAATPSGLDGPGMQTSAYDLATIFRVGMREEPFARAVGTRQIQFPGFGASPPIPVSNDNKILTTGYPGAIGGKTGFTDDARHTYIGAAARGGRRLVVVLMRGEQHPVPMYQQGTDLLDYGFALSRPQPVGELSDGNIDATTTQAGSGIGPVPGDAASSADWQVPVILGGLAVVGLALIALRIRNRR